MPTYEINIPGQGTFQVQSDKELTDEQAYRAALQQAGPVQAPPVQVTPTPEISKPAEAARALGQGLSLGFSEELEAALRSGSISGPEYEAIRDRLRIQQQAFREQQPALATGLELAGGLALPGVGLMGRVPSLARSIATGAGLGAAQGVGTATEDVGGGAVTGAMLGGALGGAGGVIGGMLAPQIRPGAAALQREGVQLTPGAAFGGTIENIEQQAQSIPVIGQMISGARQEAFSQFNKVAVNRALKPIGQKLPEDIGTTRDAVAYAKQAITDSYNQVVPNLTFKVDSRFNSALNGINSRYSKGQLGPDQQKQLKDTIKNIKNQIGTGQVSGQRVQALKQDLDDLVSSYSGATGSEKQLGDALKQIRTTFSNTLRNQNPDFAPQLRKTDEAFANLVRVETAARKPVSEEGVFTPAQLAQAVREQDKSMRKGAFARGEALMQDLAGQAQTVLGSKVPDSGTAGRTLTAALLGGGAGYVDPLAGALTLGASSLYTPIGQRLLMPLIAGARPQQVQSFGEMVRRAAPYSVPSLLNLMEQ